MTVGTHGVHSTVGTDWIVSNAVVGDEEIYELEAQKVFGTCWLYVGHETQLPSPGDFITNYMGEDSVIVTRDPAGVVHVLLNKCRHRGNRLCLYDRGSAPFFKCSYHGWCYSPDGHLYSVPMLGDAYFDELDRNSLSLVEAQVETYGGLIFASWNPIVPFDTYLGEARWYLDRFLLATDAAGMEVVPCPHRYFMPGNWKLLAENFAGDHYHFATTHQSFAMLRKGNISEENRYCVCPNFYTEGAAHGIDSFYTDDGLYEADLKGAEELGDDAVAWVKERRSRVLAALGEIPVKPVGFGGATLFPNLSLNSTNRSLQATGLLQWHPRGPFRTEVWQWCLVEQGAPESVKQHMISGLLHGQGVAGLVGPDDGENFERIASNTKTTIARQVPFHYAMGVGHEDAAKERRRPDLACLPGLVAPAVSEVNQRQFYKYWMSLMERQNPWSSEAIRPPG